MRNDEFSQVARLSRSDREFLVDVGRVLPFGKLIGCAWNECRERDATILTSAWARPIILAIDVGDKFGFGVQFAEFQHLEIKPPRRRCGDHVERGLETGERLSIGVQEAGRRLSARF